MKNKKNKRKLRTYVRICFFFLLSAGFLITCRFEYEDEEATEEYFYEENPIFNPNDKSYEKESKDENEAGLPDIDENNLPDNDQSENDPGPFDIQELFFNLFVICNNEFGKYSIFVNDEFQIMQDDRFIIKAGGLVTIKIMPNLGYKLTGEPVMYPLNSVSIARLPGCNEWMFCMTEENMELFFEFTNLETTDIFKGGFREGITIVELEDDPKFYPGTVEIYTDESSADNGSVLKISAAGNRVIQSFGLYSEQKIDLNEVKALSFWAKANRSVNLRYVGFGDADPDNRVIYSGEGATQAVPVNSEWKCFIVPLPAPVSNQKINRVFIFNAQISAGDCIYIDNMEFIKEEVTLTNIEIPEYNNSIFYGSAGKEELLKGAPVKLAFITSEGITVTMQNKAVNSLKYNLNDRLLPYTDVFYNANNSSARLCITMNGVTSNYMTADIKEGLLLDNFEDFKGDANVTIPATPSEKSRYLWHTGSSSPVVTVRQDFTVDSSNIHSGAASGNWRPTATANTVRGGRNFNPIDASHYNTLVFRIKVTSSAGEIYNNVDFTFELKNNGTLNNKTTGDFYTQLFNYSSDGWQEIKIDLNGYIEAGLDITAITGYAFGMVDKHGIALRIMLDDIAFIRE